MPVNNSSNLAETRLVVLVDTLEDVINVIKIYDERSLETLYTFS